ncbi:MAG: TIGR03790 family protein [Verrucomicrobiota bacterium]
MRARSYHLLRTAWALAALVVLGALPSVAAQETGDAVAVVYNRRMEESKRVAEHYAAKRKVPAQQVIGLNLPMTESMSRKDFERLLQEPLLETFEKRGLLTFKDEKSENGKEKVRKVTEARIRYVALCYGVPVRIERDSAIDDPAAEKIPKELRRNEAAVDADLALLPSLHRKLPLAGPLQSSYYRATNALALGPTNGLLLVTRLDGPTEAIAKGLVDRALEAEALGLWGRAYIDVRGLTNGMYKEGDDWLRVAANVCVRAGFETAVDEHAGTFTAAFPMSQVALYAGWYDGDVSGPFTRAKVEFMPGAFAYHLHSYSAHEVRNANKFWVGPLLAKGVTATMGSVDEPYLGGTPDIGVFFGFFVGAGYSFGEAAYVCQRALSWQTTVVGDPLYRPFAVKPQAQHEKLLTRGSKLIEWSHLKVVNLNIATGLKGPQLIPYLEQVPTTSSSAVLMEKLGELYLENGDTEKGIAALGKALVLDPTPQQAVRLVLRLAPLLEKAGRPKEAYGVYEKLWKFDPDYPDRAGIHRAMLALAQKLNLSEAIQRHERELKK